MRIYKNNNSCIHPPHHHNINGNGKVSEHGKRKLYVLSVAAVKLKIIKIYYAIFMLKCKPESRRSTNNYVLTTRWIRNCNLLKTKHEEQR